ncbi:hypothetical protein LTS08_007745 [Lithohypha guttulata]|nr:hypothetical protein LTS08_007745 [Lithohypha guttulata]
MITAEQYQLCKGILDNKDLEEEDKVEQLEELLRKESKLSGTSLENAVLDALWRYRNAARGEDDPTPRHTIIRKSSPAPWQINRAPTPLGSPPSSSSPALSSAFPSRPSFNRQRSAASPFASPRPSPRLALAQPIPHSPSLNTYEFSDTGPLPDIYGDFGSDTVDWLVADETASNASSTGTASLSAAAPEWVPQPDMSPYDMLRSVLGGQLSDDYIETALVEHSYDLATTIAALLGSDKPGTKDVTDNIDGNILVGKSITAQARPGTPGSSKSPIVCKYWLASGSCLRADCRFAHDTSGYLCKYWMSGQCLAGDKCQFSHDPSVLMTHLNLNEQLASPGPTFQLQDSNDQFPALGNIPRGPSGNPSFNPSVSGFSPSSRGVFSGIGPGSRPHSRPNSRHQNRPNTPSSLSMDDPDAFPTLGSIAAKRGTKHHGHRSRHGHGSNEKDTPASLADLIKMSPSPAPAQLRKSDPVRRVKASSGADTVAARRIPEPQHIPWLETGSKANQQYLKYRADAIKHGSIRNKFLQSAAQAWNRNDARAAKALSLRGQAENEEMRKAHRAAAEALYQERNNHLHSSDPSSVHDQELYIDLHGLHPEEAIEYLEDILSTHEKRGRRIIYAITGTGHHSKNGKDKVGKGVRGWLNEWGYTFREFSVPGERGGYIGGVLGIDITSHGPRRQMQGLDEEDRGALNTMATTTSTGGSTKIQLLKKEELIA